MSQLATIILALTSTAALALLSLAWWIWRRSPLSKSTSTSTSKSLAAPPARSMEDEPTLKLTGPRPPRAAVSGPPEPSETVVFAPGDPSGTVVFARREPSGTMVFAPSDPSGTVVFAPREPSGTVVFVPPEPSGTVVFAPPEPSGTMVFALPESSRATQDHTEVVSLAEVLVAASPDDSEQSTVIVSREQLFGDKTDAMSRAEILTMARAARAETAHEEAEVAEVAEAEDPEPTTPRAKRPAAPADRPPPKRFEPSAAALPPAAPADRPPPRRFETSAGALPPPAWRTVTGKPASSEAEITNTRQVTPTPTSESSAAQTISPAKPLELSDEVLREHFEGAATALQQALADGVGRDLLALADGPQTRWQSNLDVLALNGELATQQVLLPTLLDAQQGEDRRLAAALALLSMKDSAALLDALDDFDEGCHRAVTTALALLDDDVRAESITRSGSARLDAKNRLDWLRVFVRRAADPGPEILRELLTSREPSALALGLRLLPAHAKPQSFAGQVDRSLLSTTPEIRSGAIVAGLLLGRPSAWMQCKQAARSPDSADPCLLLATLGSDRDLARLISWAERAAAPAYTGWVLGVCGRPAGIRASLGLAGRGDDLARELALEGFNVATGADASTAAAAASWWDEHGDRLEDGQRILLGEPRTPASLGAAFQRGSPRWREALMLELLVRSKGELRLPTTFLPSRVRSLAASLQSLEFDLDAEYQAGASKGRS